MNDSDIIWCMSRSGSVWDNAEMESCFSAQKTGRIARISDKKRGRAYVFDYIERFYNATRRHSTIGRPSPVVGSTGRRNTLIF